MNLIKPTIKFFLLSLLINLTACKAPYPELEDGLYAEFITSKGIMVAKLENEKVPITVANFVSLAEGTNTMVDKKYAGKKFYNGTIFHRVMDNFMIQGGDPKGTGFGNAGYRFMDEFHPDLKHDKPGILSMANPGPNSNSSQFFITEVPKPSLDNKHSVFGELVIGLNIQDSISNVETNERNKPLKDVVLEELNIIRKGKAAKQFDAPKIFINHFAEAERLEKEKAERAEAIIKASKEKFNTQEANAITLESGLKYIVTEKGSGEKLPIDAEVLTHYAVYFENGKLLETSKLEIAEALDAVNENRKAADKYQPLTANIGPNARMIPGFKEGLQQLHVGDKATFFIPYHLAYGEAGTRGIPEKSNLIFEVEVLELLK
ncbi:peptidylprolyl isomerase [Sabulilitoribacter multivorans]|uniref:peptidylprolyl isomerase n=1 Tax=Flaviramulus multivorans TaxID=1304750 RepID=A0ABS9IKG2_9FLAO|nr:peptidylprolyl isomerase [Flaviramulus multivorans]MCF7561069.1 peptidylprolyl isomerase [Flaviramulus multivorans]